MDQEQEGILHWVLTINKTLFIISFPSGGWSCIGGILLCYGIFIQLQYVIGYPMPLMIYLILTGEQYRSLRRTNPVRTN